MTTPARETQGEGWGLLLVQEHNTLRAQLAARDARIAELEAERDRLAQQLADARSYILADEERRKLTGDALQAEEERDRLAQQLTQALARIQALATPPPTPAPAAGETTAWLIELGQAEGHVPPLWWRGQVTGPEARGLNTREFWTENATEARKFATKREAERTAYWLAPHVRYAITEHVFLAKAPPTPAPAQGELAALWELQEGYYHPVNQVWFRAGLIACREYMARFIEAENPSIAASIRANWWPLLGKDFGPPRLLRFDELMDGERARTADEISPTQEALPIALGFLEQPIEAAALDAARGDTARGNGST